MIPSREIVSTGAWNGLEPGTSRKSANQPRVRVTVGPPGFVTATSASEPGESEGVEIWSRVAPIALAGDRGAADGDRRARLELVADEHDGGSAGGRART